jgi:hypothetical protein
MPTHSFHTPLTYSLNRSQFYSHTPSFTRHATHIPPLSLATQLTYPLFHSPLNSHTHSSIHHAFHIPPLSLATSLTYPVFHSPRNSHIHSFTRHVAHITLFHSPLNSHNHSFTNRPIAQARFSFQSVLSLTISASFVTGPSVRSFALDSLILHRHTHIPSNSLRLNKPNIFAT